MNLSCAIADPDAELSESGSVPLAGADIDMLDVESEIRGEVLDFAMAHSAIDSLLRSLELARSIFGAESDREVRLEPDPESDHVCIVVNVEFGGSVDGALSRYQKYLDAWCADPLASPLIRLTFHFAIP